MMVDTVSPYPGICFEDGGSMNPFPGIREVLTHSLRKATFSHKISGLPLSSPDPTVT